MPVATDEKIEWDQERLEQVRAVANPIAARYEVDPEELLSETLLLLVRKHEHYDAARGWGPWVTKQATWAALTMVRERIRRQRELTNLEVVDEDGATVPLVEVLPDPRPSHEEVVDDLDEQEFVISQLGHIPPASAAILRKRHGVGLPDPMTFEDIAAELGVSPAVARRRYRAAIIDIRRRIGLPTLPIHWDGGY